MNHSGQRRVFITGSTGFIGRALCEQLLQSGHEVRALARPGSETRVIPGCRVVSADPFDPGQWHAQCEGVDALVHLIGVHHPSPLKNRQFESVDGGAFGAVLSVARMVDIPHFVFVSVAQPLPIMRTYQKVRARSETSLRDSGIPATVLRPAYVLGPGRRWPMVLMPIQSLLRIMPWTRGLAIRSTFIDHRIFIRALCAAIDNPPSVFRVWEAPQIIASGLACG
jgi:uncharacterized protein YbjT (DUF2867 family)